jgi:hypothetical protein
VAVDHPFNAVAEMEDVEIDEEADTDSAEAHVRQQLRLVNGMEGLGRFHFHYDSMFHDQIDAISDFEFVALIDDGQGYFSCDFETAASQFVRQAGLVCALKKTWPEDGVHLQGSIYDRTGYVVYVTGMGSCGRGHPYCIT